jgi:hypothetical protein
MFTAFAVDAAIAAVAVMADYHIIPLRENPARKNQGII